MLGISRSRDSNLVMVLLLLLVGGLSRGAEGENLPAFQALQALWGEDYQLTPLLPTFMAMREVVCFPNV